jgi:hypothetical protein
VKGNVQGSVLFPELSKGPRTVRERRHVHSDRFHITLLSADHIDQSGHHRESPRNPANHQRLGKHRNRERSGGYESFGRSSDEGRDALTLPVRAQMFDKLQSILNVFEDILMRAARKVLKI